MLRVIASRKKEAITPHLRQPIQVFAYLKEWDVIVESEKQFTQMLTAGTAFTVK